jgi:hypothetical protein
MNHHADKLLLDCVESGDSSASQLVEAYSCPYCGTNASRIVSKD